MRISFVLLAAGLFFSSSTLVAAELERQSLFKIERSKNANIIQYDAQIDPGGKLNKKKPVIGYWIRLADIGQPIQVRYEDGQYRAIVELDGQSSELDKIFIQAHGKGISV